MTSGLSWPSCSPRVELYFDGGFFQKKKYRGGYGSFEVRFKTPAQTADGAQCCPVPVRVSRFTFWGVRNSMEAEYAALLAGLRKVTELVPSNAILVVYTDCQSVERTMTGNCRSSKNKRLQKFEKAARHWMTKFRRWSFRRISKQKIFEKFGH